MENACRRCYDGGKQKGGFVARRRMNKSNPTYDKEEGEVMIEPMVALAVLEAMLLTASANSAEPIERQAKLTAAELTCEYAVNPLGSAS